MSAHSKSWPAAISRSELDPKKETGGFCNGVVHVKWFLYRSRTAGRASQDCVSGSRSSISSRSLFGSWKAVLRPVACVQDPGARGRGQGTETLAEPAACPP